MYNTILTMIGVQVVFCVLILSIANPVQGIFSRVLRPIPDKVEPEQALVIVPGAYIPGIAYRPLAIAMQQSSPVKLWVGLTDGYIDNLPNPLQLGEAIQECLKNMTSFGMKTTTVFIGGHSLGGTFLSNYVHSNPRGITGILLFGSYVTRNFKLVEFPVPVLTISGDLDGLTRITRIAETFNELNKTIMQYRNDSLMFKYPVVTLQGVNHGQFASGVMPPNVKDHDIPAELSNDFAHQAISNYSSFFMISVSQKPIEWVKYAHLYLAAVFSANNLLMKPIIDSMAMVSNGAHSAWSLHAQFTISTLLSTSPYSVKFSDQLLNEIEFLVNEPTFALDGDIVNVVTKSNVQYPAGDIVDVSLDPITASQVQTKMISRNIFLGKLRNASFGEYADCRQINQNGLAYALKQSSSIALSRFRSSGKKVLFVNDTVLSSEDEWINRELGLQYSDKGLLVTGIAYKDDSFHHCKLIGPSRILEYIYVDSLRPIG